jgi:hypothetical protein
MLAGSFGAYQWVPLQVRNSAGDEFLVTWNGVTVSVSAQSAGKAPVVASKSLEASAGSHPVAWFSLVVDGISATANAAFISTARVTNYVNVSVAAAYTGPNQRVMQNVSFANVPGARACVTEAWVQPNDAIVQPLVTAVAAPATWYTSLRQAPLPEEWPPFSNETRLSLVLLPGWDVESSSGICEFWDAQGYAQH